MQLVANSCDYGYGYSYSYSSGSASAPPFGAHTQRSLSYRSLSLYQVDDSRIRGRTVLSYGYGYGYNYSYS